MSIIPDRYLKQLINSGLFVSEPFPEGHVWEHGVRVGKPTAAKGNLIPGYEAGYVTMGDEVEPPEMDAPYVVLFSKGKEWFVRAQECIPKPGHGDFTNVWTTADEAVQDILDFYFGDPARMLLKAERKMSSSP